MGKLADVLNDLKIRYLFVGVLNTIVGYATYALCIYLGVKYPAALLITYAVGIIHSYLWNKFFTFRSYDKSVSEGVRFFLVYVAAYLVNMAMLYIGVDVLKMNAYFVGAIAMALTTAASYIGHKKISFKKR